MGKYDYLKLAKAKKWSEKEMNAFKNAVNNSERGDEYLNAFYENPLIEEREGIALDKSQVEKGRKWLYNLGFTPKGKVRISSPYGYREEYIVQNLKDIRVLSLHDAGSGWYKFYVPYYEAIGEDGTSMEYFVSGGDIHIYG